MRNPRDGLIVDLSLHLTVHPGRRWDVDIFVALSPIEAPRVQRRCLRHDDHMELREGLTVEDSFLDEFAVRHGIHRLALYGSALRADFGPASDIDLLVEFQPGRTPGLLHLAQMELELETAIGRQVELRTYEDLSRYFRDRVASTARPLYAA